MGFVTVARSEEVPEGEASAFDVDGTEIAIARVDETLYAFGDVCSHRRCNLANGGELDGATIICECHGSVFDLRTGEALNPPATDPIPVYQIRESDGHLQVEV